MASLESTREILDSPQRCIRRRFETNSCIAALLIVSLGIAGSIEVHGSTSASLAEVSPSNILLWKAGLLPDEEPSINPWDTVVRDIDELLALDAEFHKYRALDSMVWNTTDARLDEIFKQSKKIEDSSLRRSLLHYVFLEMARRQPERALDIALSFPSDNTRFLVSGVFRAWAISDLDASINRAKKLEEPNRTIALEAILVYGHRMAINQDRDLRLELGEDLYIDDLLEKSYSQLPVEELKQAWDSMIDSHFLGVYRTSSLKDIAAAWIDTANYQYQFVPSICRSMPNVYERSWVLDFLLKQVSETDLRPAFELAVECYENQMDVPLITVVMAWGHRDPVEALQAISSMELTSLRYPLRRIAVEEWARTVPDKVLRNPDLLPNDLREWGVACAVKEVARRSPRRATRLISKVHEDYLKRVEAEITSYWSDSSWKAPLRWLESRSKRGTVSIDSWNDVFYRVVEEDPIRAFKIARRNSPTSQEDGLESIVVVQVARKDARQAKLFLAQMNDGRAKFVAGRELGKFLVVRNRFDEAIELRELLNESERSEYLHNLFGYWAESDPVELFTWVKNTDDLILRHRGVLALEKADARRKSLSDPEMQQIRSLALLK